MIIICKTFEKFNIRFFPSDNTRYLQRKWEFSYFDSVQEFDSALKPKVIFILY